MQPLKDWNDHLAIDQETSEKQAKEIQSAIANRRAISRRT